MLSIGQYLASDYQHTLKDSITIIGRGLHSGLPVIMTLMPADSNTGYVFLRRDVAPLRAEVPARWNTVVDTRLSTTVANAFGTRVGTIEHLLAALSVCGVHNARIVLDAPEVPIMDGSAAPFVDLLNTVGLERQAALIQALVIDKPLVVREHNKHVSLVPADEFSVDMSIDFDNPVIGRQSMDIKVNVEIFSQQLAPARTFCFQEQLYTSHTLGLARGGTLNNAILIEDNGVINTEGLRFDDEFVRHKIVDTLGDISLLGACIIGKFVGRRSGHQLNNQLMRTLMMNADCWHCVPLAEHRRQNEIVQWCAPNS
jgi:UDP-3-O-[3-hydroxymyristoyl] N-acetylglucosamine deacetylase